ncbi:MAG: ABC transporter permease [Thermoplasmata archaeon]
MADTEDDEDTSYLGTEGVDLEAELADLEQKKTSQFNLVWLRFKRNKLAIIGAGIIITLVLLAILAPLLAPYGPLEQNIDRKLEDPSSDHLLGTDYLGRDIFSRLLYGARNALLIGLGIVGLAGGIGVSLGLIAGSFGGIVDEVIMRLTDTFLAFPVLVLAIALATAMGMGQWPVVVAVGIIMWTRFARVTRGEILSLKQERFIEAAEAIGESRFSIIMRYLLPNVLPSIVVVATIQMPAALLYDAALSYLGVGIQPPNPSWGGIASKGQTFMLTSPWMVTFAGIAIVITVLGFNFMGDGLRDALDPMTRGGK